MKERHTKEGEKEKEESFGICALLACKEVSGLEW